MRKILAVCLSIAVLAASFPSLVQAQRNNSYRPPPPRPYQAPQRQFSPQRQIPVPKNPGQPGYRSPNLSPRPPAYQPSPVQEGKREAAIIRLRDAQTRKSVRRIETDEARRSRLIDENKFGFSKSPQDTTPRNSNAPKTLVRPLTSGEIQKGFTGKVTPDGKALIKFGTRIVTVPASRVSGRNIKLSANDTRPRTERLVEQQKNNILKLKGLAANNNSPGKPGGKNGGSGGGGCQPPESPKCQFNSAAAAKSRTSLAKATRLSNSIGSRSDANNVVNSIRLKGQLLGSQIANGHAYDKHVKKEGSFNDLGIADREQFAKHIENVVNYPTATKTFGKGRTAYWHEPSNTIVIRNPNQQDGGTAFRPKDRRAYYEKLK